MHGAHLRARRGPGAACRAGPAPIPASLTVLAHRGSSDGSVTPQPTRVGRPIRAAAGSATESGRPRRVGGGGHPESRPAPPPPPQWVLVSLWVQRAEKE